AVVVLHPFPTRRSSDLCAGISHDGAATGGFCLYATSLGFKGPGMVGPELVAQFMGDKIQIETVPLRNGGRGEGTALSVVHTDRTDIARVPIVLGRIGDPVEEMAHIVIGLPNEGGEGILYLGIEAAGIG